MLLLPPLTLPLPLLWLFASLIVVDTEEMDGLLVGCVEGAPLALGIREIAIEGDQEGHSLGQKELYQNVRSKRKVKRFGST